MAGFFQQFLKGAGDGFFGSPYLRDYRHASNIFVRDAFGNAPKFKWLFHVYFDINKSIISNNVAAAEAPGEDIQSTVFPADFNPGLLVKSIDLPKYNLGVQELNQYNRKRYVHTKITYDPVRITFHDDNNNQIRHMWQSYYGYYFNDPTQPMNGGTRYSRTADYKSTSELNIKNTYSPTYQNKTWGYAAEITRANQLNRSPNGTPLNYKIPFFKSIKIYGFNQHNFALYVLINPIINSFTHDGYSYYDNGIMENSMTINYESVKYYEGALNGENPSSIVQGFGEDNVYDRTLSPIARPGSNRTILGQGGLADAGIGILENIQQGNIAGAVQIAGRTARTFRNGNDVARAARSEVIAGAIGAVSRSQFNIPGAGTTTTGVGSQQANATNARRTTPAPIERRT
jgi:hypothetical protein